MQQNIHKSRIRNGASMINSYLCFYFLPRERDILVTNRHPLGIGDIIWVLMVIFIFNLSVSIYKLTQ